MNWNPWPKADEKGLARYVLPSIGEKVKVRPSGGRSAADLHAAGDYRALTRAIYEALCQRDIHWSRASYHPDSKSQVIRHPESILNGSGEGTCLDLALLFAGVLLGYGLLPLVVVLDGHALVAVSLTSERRKSDSTQREQSIDDGGEGTWWVDSGVLNDSKVLKHLVDRGTYEIIECTGFSRTIDSTINSFPEDRGRVDGLLSWQQAVSAGRAQLEVTTRAFRFAVDPGYLQDILKIGIHLSEPYSAKLELDDGAARRLLKSSRRLFDDLTRQMAGPKSDQSNLAAAAASMYVRRECQDELLRKLVTPGSQPQILSGEAGHGKSSLLWDLTRELSSAPQVTALLISSGWLSPTGHEPPLFSILEVIESTRSFRASHSNVVVLLDTADLLLHNENSVHRTHELIESLVELSVGVIVAVRPQEQQELREGLGQITSLGAFSATERDRAVAALMKRHFPHYPEEQGLELVKKAVARGLAVVEISESPFLLKLLFELAGDVLPSMEIDITGLYRQYWERRIKSDFRGMVGVPSKDLTALAGHAGIAMLAEGTPEPQNFALDMALSQIRQHLHLPESGIDDDLATLVQRGVLIRDGERTRYMHQTLFEYCAAMGLAYRGGSRELIRLVNIAFDFPEDYFIGTVLEQLLTIMAGQPSARAVVTKELDRLLKSNNDALKQLGVLSWVHDPSIVADIETPLRSLPSTAVIRFVRIIPRVWGMNISDLRFAFGLVWNRKESSCKHEVVRALGRLARSQPLEIAELVKELKCIEYFTSAGRVTLSNPRQLFDLVFALGKVAPDMVSESVLRLFGAIEYPESRILLINLVAEHWGAIGSQSLHDEIIVMLRQEQAENDDERGRSVRDALGALLFAFWTNQEGVETESKAEANAAWVSRAAEIRESLVADPRDVVAGAGLFALARHLCSDDLTEEHIRRVLDEIWAIEDLQAQRKLVSNLLAPLLIEDGLARQVLVPKLAEQLDQLPVTPNADVLSPAQSWASVARSVLEDERLDPEVIRAVVSRMTLRCEELWLSRDYLVSLLSQAVRGNIPSAREAIREIAADPEVLGPADQTKFANECLRHASKDPALTLAYVAVATHRGDTGGISVAVRDASLAEAFKQEKTRLAGFVEVRLRGNDTEQRQALNLWSRLQRARVVDVSLEDLVGVMPTLRHPTVKASALSMVPLTVSAHPGDYDAAVEFLGRFVAVQDGITVTPAESSRSNKPGVLDAAAASLRLVLAEHGPPSCWPMLRALIATPKHTGKEPHEASVFLAGNKFIRRTFDVNGGNFAVGCFIDLGALIPTLGFRHAQIEAASNCLYSAAQLIIRESSADALGVLVRSLPQHPRHLAEVISRLSLHLRRTTVRPIFEEMLTHGRLGILADYISHNLRNNFVGVVGGALPELLEPA
ncbi:NACHT domain-containing protein [Arthrobacter sp. B1I2]|uniref:NACHT domain-containing protein n=1 Tax=Arthrobacter sp. B1I2 TaxID=3042263 RepID=UPI0027D885C5|nr:hypothetical protein [Arthrobacter sp. B1I2]